MYIDRRTSCWNLALFYSVPSGLHDGAPLHRILFWLVPCLELYRLHPQPGSPIPVYHFAKSDYNNRIFFPSHNHTHTTTTASIPSLCCPQCCTSETSNNANVKRVAYGVHVRNGNPVLDGMLSPVSLTQSTFLAQVSRPTVSKWSKVFRAIHNRVTSAIILTPILSNDRGHLSSRVWRLALGFFHSFWATG